jgi:hypothetical protein
MSRHPKRSAPSGGATEVSPLRPLPRDSDNGPSPSQAPMATDNNECRSSCTPPTAASAFYSSSVSRTRSAMTAGSSSIANATVRSKPCGPVIRTRKPPDAGGAHRIHASGPLMPYPPIASSSSRSSDFRRRHVRRLTALLHRLMAPLGARSFTTAAPMQRREHPVDVVNRKSLGIKIVVNPIPQCLMLIVVGVTDSIQEIVKSPDAPTIFGWAGELAAGAHRIGRVRISRQALLEDNAVLPGVAKIIRVYGLCADLAQ